MWQVVALLFEVANCDFKEGNNEVRALTIIN